jgi:hypothetical protein
MTVPKFVKRRNRDSSIDSICTSCFQTIASAACEEELAIHEEKHTCDPYGDFSLWYLNSDRRNGAIRAPHRNIQRAE